MKKLKVIGVFATVLLLAGLFALASCKKPTEITTIEKDGAAILSFDPLATEIKETEFTLSSDADHLPVLGENPGEQTVGYAVNTSATTAPTGSYTSPSGLKFTGRTANTTYYIWARTLAKTVDDVYYLPGEPKVGENPVKTLAATGGSEAVNEWDPNPSWDPDEEDSFALKPATAVVSGHEVGYKITITPTTSSASGWTRSPVFSLSEITEDLSVQYYVHATTRASSDAAWNAAGARSAPLSLPAPKLEVTNWGTVANSDVTGNAGAVTITGIVFTMTPNIPGLEIVYSVSAGSANAPLDKWGTLNSSNKVSFSSLASNTQYFLWARTKATTDNTNIKAGGSIMYENSVFTTGASGNSPQGLANTINLANVETTNPGNVSPSTAEATVVILGGNVTLGADITIPEGMTVRIANNGVLKTGLFSVYTGKIEISNGGVLYCNGDNIGSLVTVNAGGLYYSSGDISTTAVPAIGDGSTSPPAVSGVINLSSGSMTVKYMGNNRYDWTVAGGKAATATGKIFALSYGSTFTIENGAEFAVAQASELEVAGRIVVNSGGKLVLPASYDFKGGLNTTTGEVVINAGAEVEVAAGTKFITASTAAAAGDFILESGTIVLINRIKTGGTTEEGRVTLTGEAKTGKATADVGTGSVLFTINGSSKLTVQKDHTLDVKVGAFISTLTNTGQLILEANTTANGGTLTIDTGGILNGRGNTNVNSMAAVGVSGGTISDGIINLTSGARNMTVGTSGTISGGTINVNNGTIDSTTPNNSNPGLTVSSATGLTGGTINVNSGGVMDFSGSGKATGGAIKVYSGGVMKITPTTEVLGGTVTADIQGTLVLDKTHMATIIGTTGDVKISGTGEIRHTDNKRYIGFSKAAPNDGVEFELANNTQMTIRKNTNPSLLVLTASGNVSLAKAPSLLASNNGTYKTAALPVNSTLVVSSTWAPGNDTLLDISGSKLYIGGTLIGPTGSTNPPYFMIKATAANNTAVRKATASTAMSGNVAILVDNSATVVDTTLWGGLYVAGSGTVW